MSEFNKFDLPARCDEVVQQKRSPFTPLIKTMKKMAMPVNTGLKSLGLGKPSEQNQEKFKGGKCKSKFFEPLETDYNNIHLLRKSVSEEYLPCDYHFSDYQEIKLNELFKTLAPGLIPRSLCVILQNSLVEACKPGDDVMITGIMIQRWKNMPPQPGTRPYVELAFVANNVEVLNKREFSKSNSISQERIAEYKGFWKKHNKIEGKKILINSVCSNMFERNEIKLGMLLSLIGGVSQKLEEQAQMKIRGQIHMLMVGEPGTGKS